VNLANQPLIDAHYPGTFRERGTAAPFTAPLLAGARVRDANRSETEVLVPNPSGRRGVYILHWASVRERYRPTVHDTVLFQRISALDRLDPPAMRAAAWGVAREGLAGPEARIAAEAAAESDRAQSVLAHFLLLVGLVEQAEPRGLTITSAMERTKEFDHRGTVVLQRLAPSLGRSVPELQKALLAMSLAFAPIGVAPDDSRARLFKQLIQLQDTRDNMARSFEANQESESIRLGRSVTASMETSFMRARTLLSATRTMLADPMTLLAQWLANPAQVTALAVRTEWVLDGWERICLLWHSAQHEAARRAALLEMAQLVPVLPRETLNWCKTPFSMDTLDPACRVTSHDDGWRTGGAAFALIGRNEKLRAMST